MTGEGREAGLRMLIVSPRQPRIPRAPRPREVVRNGEGRIWSWTVGECRRLLAVLDEHLAAHDYPLAASASTDGRTR